MSKFRKFLSVLGTIAIGAVTVIAVLVLMGAVHFVNAWFMGVGQ